MGIDVYMKWRGQTEAQAKAQITGFSIVAGQTGYLREAYHGGPYVTQFLCREAFDADNCTAKIPAATLRKRLPWAIRLAIKRGREIYKETYTEKSPAVQSFVRFVELAEKIEAETGEPVTIYASY